MVSMSHVQPANIDPFVDQLLESFLFFGRRPDCCYHFGLSKQAFHKGIDSAVVGSTT